MNIIRLHAAAHKRITGHKITIQSDSYAGCDNCEWCAHLSPSRGEVVYCHGEPYDNLELLGGRKDT